MKTEIRLFYGIVGFFDLLFALGFFTMPQEVKNCFYVSDGVYLFFAILMLVSGLIFILFSIFGDSKEENSMEVVLNSDFK